MLVVMAGDWLILHGGAMGDLVLTIQLALRLPRAEIDGRFTVLARANLGDLSQCRPPVYRISADGLGLHWLHVSEQENSPAAADGASAAAEPPARLAELVRDRRVLSALDGPESRVHQRLATLAPAALFSVDPQPRGDMSGHIVDQWQRDLEAQGLLFDRCVYRARPAGSLRHPESNRGPDSAIVIHPGSGGREKCWSRLAYVEVASELQGHGWSVQFVVGPTEQEWWGRDGLAKLRAVAPLAVCASTQELASRLTAATAYVGNDSGPTHLAALLGTPTVALFGPTRAARWRPLGARVVVIAAEPAEVRAREDWGIATARVIEALVAVAAT